MPHEDDGGLFRQPLVSLPTIGTLAVAIAAWPMAVKYLPNYACVLVASWCIYACFTVLHDASHRSVSRIAWLNEAVGRVATVPFLFSTFTGFRWNHSLHHKHTNVVGLDPDHSGSHSLGWKLPFNWAILDLHYYHHLIAHWRSCPLSVRVESVITLAAMAVLIASLFMSQWRDAFLLYWLLPSRIAVFFLGFAFDFLPHANMDAEKWRTTAWVRLPGAQLLLSLLLFNQDYHLVHHMWPTVAFYRYVAVFGLRRAKFADNGAREHSIWSLRMANIENETVK